MSGHSKWATIKRKKGKTDAQRAKLFAKIGREISVVVRDGGGDPNENAKLRDLIAKAKNNNVPNENIERIIKKAQGEGDKNNYEEMLYEGYGPNGVAVIVSALTDNKNRTASDVRCYFDKYGGNLGTTGCVSFMFERKGLIIIENKKFDEEKLMEDVVESGASDYAISEEIVEVYTEVADLYAVSKDLQAKGYDFESCEIEYIPANYVKLVDENSVVKMEKLIDCLEDNDDVQNIWHNWEID